MSTLRVNNMTNVGGTGPTYAPGHVVQVVNSLCTNSLSGTLGTSTNPTSTSGTQLHSVSFTPKFATSKILITTSNIIVGEYGNYNNQFFAAAFYDTTRIAMVTATLHYQHVAGSLNVGYYTFNNMFNSWGTSTKDIVIRVGGDNGSSMYANRTHDIGNYIGDPHGFSMTVMEVAA